MSAPRMLQVFVRSVNDGLSSNLSLVMGIAGVSFNNDILRATGLAGLTAGAISIGLAEWISVMSSNASGGSAIPLKVHGDEDRGLDPEKAADSALHAGASSFLFFAAGGFVPVSPFFFLAGATAVHASLPLSVLALLALGGIRAVFTGKPVPIAREVALSLARAGLTFGVGRLLGVALS